MAKATALTLDDLKPKASPKAAISPRSIAAETQKIEIVPLQIRIPASEAKSIKRAALDADMSVSEFLLSCYHDRKKA